MVIFGGLELIALKWIGGKMTAALATHLAHAPATAVAHFAHAAANNVVANAAGAGSLAGAVNTLHHGAGSGYKLAKKAIRIQEKEERIGSLFGGGGKDLTDEQRSELLVVMTLIHLMEGYYTSLERPAALKPSSTKTALDEMEPCRQCACRDYDQNIGRRCECGHQAGSHHKITEAQLNDPDSFEWLQRGMAEQVYPLFENRDGDGDVKTRLSQVDTCVEYGCPCWDFDRDYGREFFSRRCTCGHRFREHQVTGEWRWIVELIIAKTIEALLGEDSSSSSESDLDEEVDDDDDDTDGDDDGGGGNYESEDDDDNEYNDSDSDF